VQWFCSFLTPNFNGLWLHLRVADNSESHYSSPEAFGHMSPHCRFSDLGPFRLRIFSAQVRNGTRAHGDESNPLEISMSSAMKGEPSLATGLTTLGAQHPFIHAWKAGHRNLCQVRNEPSASYCSTEGVAPLHTAPPVPVLLILYEAVVKTVVESWGTGGGGWGGGGASLKSLSENYELNYFSP
jgi:hypothetical protein